MLVTDVGDRLSGRIAASVRHLIHMVLHGGRTATDSETALVVLIPRVDECLVEAGRAPYTGGMPSHITILYPFVRRSSLTSSTISRLRRTFGEVEPFAFDLSEVGWFDDRVLYLAPSPTAKFEELTHLIVSTFPGYKPYRGEFAEIIPHVTLAEGESQSQLRELARVVSGMLPIHGEVDAVYLMTHNRSGSWETNTRFELGLR